MAEPSQAAVKLITRDGGQLPAPGRRDTLWLVYKWEGLQPLALYPSAEQQLPVFFWAQGSNGQTRARFRMLRWAALASHVLRELWPKHNSTMFFVSGQQETRQIPCLQVNGVAQAWFLAVHPY